MSYGISATFYPSTNINQSYFLISATYTGTLPSGVKIYSYFGLPHTNIYPSDTQLSFSSNTTVGPPWTGFSRPVPGWALGVQYSVLLDDSPRYQQLRPVHAAAGILHRAGACAQHLTHRLHH